MYKTLKIIVGIIIIGLLSYFSYYYNQQRWGISKKTSRILSIAVFTLGAASLISSFLVKLLR